MPLFVIVLIKNSQLRTVSFGIELLVIILLGYIPMKMLMRQIKSLTAREEKVIVLSEKNSEHLTFLFTFVIPVCVGLTNINDWVIFIITLFLVCYLYMDSSLFCVNPMLKLDLGFNIYEIKIGNNNFYMLSKRKIMNSEESINVKLLDRWLIIEEDKNEEA
jgi:hypothetical protein